MLLVTRLGNRIGSRVVVPPKSRFFFMFLLLMGLLAWYVWSVKAAVTIVVNTDSAIATADGLCSLPEAITAANLNTPVDTCFHDGTPGIDTIAFNIPGPGPHIIQPTAALPGITTPMTIDGTTEPDYAGIPVVVLDGFFATIGADGLYLSGGDITIRGLAINNFTGSTSGRGIYVDAGSGYTIELNHIGTDYSGTVAQGNQYDGIFLALGVTNTNITNNVISGNGQDGIALSGNGVTDITIQGNYIGTDVTGVVPLGNGRDGVHVVNANANTIGGSNPAERNIISGNGRYGVFITGLQAMNNMVLGNYIGTDAGGDSPIPNNAGVGINVSTDNHIGNTSGVNVGGICDGGCNLISGNAFQGIELIGIGTDGNIIQSNYIGTDVTGTADLGNGSFGIEINEASNTLVGEPSSEAANLISDNGNSGILIFGDNADLNSIQGNIIGLDVSGTAPLGNSLDGISVYMGDGNVIGGDVAGMGNIISGNGRHGILLNNNADSNIIQGNFIGTDVGGTADLGNTFDGIAIEQGAFNLIGGVVGQSRNLVSGNDGSGINLYGLPLSTHDNFVQGNFVGTDINGTFAIPNSYDGVIINNSAGNWVGGPTAAEGNLISGNSFAGININTSGATGNVVQNNFIGTDSTGTAALGNGFEGIFISDASQNTIGTPGAGNLISGNNSDGIVVNFGGSRDGLLPVGERGAGGNVIQGNTIGLDVSGTAVIGNNGAGVRLSDVVSNTVGGTAPGAGNLISGNAGAGVVIEFAAASGNLVTGNTIGVDATGTADLGNGLEGVVIDSAFNNVIGGMTAGAGNLISGNGTEGVKIFSSQFAGGNVVQGNTIGADVFGINAIPNDGDGILIDGFGIDNNTIGGTVAAAGNLISGNTGNGITIGNGASINFVQGNTIGTDATGTAALGNQGMGIFINESPGNTVGGSTIAARNLISGNGFEGVVLNGFSTAGNTVQNNFIGTDVSGTAAIGNNSNGISVFNAASSNLILNNVVSGNASHGVDIAFTAPSYNVVQGNIIGVDATGTAVLPNSGDGLLLNFNANNNTIGGANPGEGNIIAGNAQKGVAIGHDAYNNFIQGNFIGTDSTGVLDLGNGSVGVSLSLSATNNLIGGGPGAGNFIAFNDGAGISMLDSTTVNNTIVQNAIYANGGLGIDLNADGVTPNDIGDDDFGPNNLQNYPVLIRATPGVTTTLIQGRLDGLPKSFYNIDFFSNNSCDRSEYGEGELFLGSTTVSGLDSSIRFSHTLGINLPYGQHITAVATDSTGNSSEFSRCITVGYSNDTWVTAYESPSTRAISATYLITDFIDGPDRSRWFKFPIDPSNNLTITLTNLPANYDLTVYKDIEQAFQEEISSTEDLLLLSAEFAPDIFNPDIFNPDIFNPDIFNPDIFNPDIFNPDIFNPDIFNPDIFNPDIFNPDIFNPDAYNPDIFNPDIFNPDIFNPDIFNPDIFNDAFSSAQLRSIVAGSGREGLADEFVRVNTWNNDGYYYVRVRGRNGAYDPLAPFTLTVEVSNNVCEGVNADSLPPTSLTAVADDYHTLILVDWDELALTNDPADLATLQQRLDDLAARSEVAGVVIDVAQDARVAVARQLVNAHTPCPNAKNILADSIKAVIDLYWEANPNLEYLVLVGNDAVIPFYRHPDQGLLAPESNYIVPVFTNTPSYASLALNYLLSQDAYGARRDISIKTGELPIPELAIGRLVEDATDMITVLDAYLSTADGIIVPDTSLVTGYDFLEDAANAVYAELELGIAASPDTLISPQTVSPAEGWTADDLRAALFDNGRHDLVYMAGHFSAGSALAADYTTRVLAAEVVSSTVSMENSLIFSAGCHSGYNIVTPDGIPGITAEPDWAEAFAEKGATLVAGTGYQYGDSDFLEYGERLYWLYSQQLRTGTGPVSVGQALTAAKHEYLIDTGEETDGIYQKQVLIATLFGLPMLRIDMPGARIIPGGDGSIVTGTSTYGTPGPGQTLGLEFADVTITPDLTMQSMELVNMNNVSETVTVSYLTGGGTAETVSVKPAEPVLPLESYNVTVSGLVLRGAGFRGGTFTGNTGIRPLAGAATFDLTGPRPIFVSDYFYPTKLWDVNYMGAIVDPTNGATRLVITPAQYQSDSTGSPTGTLRQFDDMQFRLFYSDNLNTYSGNTPALSNPPTISNVYAEPDGAGGINFWVYVIGDPAAGVQEVWVTWTDGTAVSGTWQSLDLVQDSLNSTLWLGTLTNLGGANPDDVRYMVQAVNGVGTVSLATNLGSFFQPGVDPGDPGSNTAVTTTLTLESPTTVGAYGTRVEFSAILSSDNTPLADQLVTFNLGAQRTAVTDSNGRATVTLPLSLSPGEYELQVSFAGTADYQPIAASSLFTVTKQDTLLWITPTVSIMAAPGEDSLITATLYDANGNVIIQKPVFFVVEGVNGWMVVGGITNYLGEVALGPVDLPEGSYTVTAYFGEAFTLPDSTFVDLTDDSYSGATAVNTLIIGPISYQLYLPVIFRP